MHEVHDGQCGLCIHFGEKHSGAMELVQIRQTHEAPEDMVDDCGLPGNAVIHLRVSPLAGCDKYEPAPLS